MIEPDTAAWFNARIGCLTGSRFGDAIAKQKSGKWAASRETLLYELLAERLTWYAAEHFVTPAMEWGRQHEKAAVELLEVRSGVLFDPAGFILHPTIEHFGSTPDRLMGTDGVLEIKCPTTKTHLQYLTAGVVPEQYKPQMLAEMMCSSRAWARFTSYDPRLPEKQQLFVIDWTPTKEEFENGEQLAREFLAELEALFVAITEK